MPAYESAFPVGTRVRVIDRPALENFQRSWHLHNRLQDDQLGFSGESATVKTIGYYHGGDVLYQLEGLPGIWHECCLESEHQ